MRAALILIFISSAVGHAQVSSETVLGQAKHMATAGVSFTPGGLAVGLEYENNFDRTYGLGAQLRISAKQDQPAVPGVTAVGGFVRPHFTRGPWDLSIAPGLAILMLSSPNSRADVTGFGPTFSMTLMYQMTNQLAIGAENYHAYDWTGSAYRGQVSNDTMARVRLNF